MHKAEDETSAAILRQEKEEYERRCAKQVIARKRGARLTLRTGLVEPPAIVRALEPLGKVLGECRWLFTEGRWKMNLLVRLVAGTGSFRESWRTLVQAGEEPGQPSERFLALAMKVAPRVGGFDRAFELVAQMVGRKLEPTEYLIEKLAKAG